MNAAPSYTPALDFRPLEAGMGEAIFGRTYRRFDANGVGEDWGQAADRVSFGNLSLVHDTSEAVYADPEYQAMRSAMRAGVLPMSGRHLQQGDMQQRERPMEVFTNCSTAPWSFGKFYLMLNGSGVGRNYADLLMRVDWRNAPNIIQVLGTVPEAGLLHSGQHLTPGTMHPEAMRTYRRPNGDVLTFPTLEEALLDFHSEQPGDLAIFQVADTREGWAQAVEVIEAMAHAGKNARKTLILDWSAVRPNGAPIGGMQDRPASGPIDPMHSVQLVSQLKTRDFKPWKQAMYADHYLASTVQVGGARRAARIAVKPWRDADILEFITIKADDIKAGGDGLWSSNNSVGVDAEFWGLVQSAVDKVAFNRALTEAVVQFDIPGAALDVLTDDEQLAYTIFETASRAAYEDGTGEPGWLNLDKLPQNDEGLETYDDGLFMSGDRYEILPISRALSAELVQAARQLPYKNIVNPCGEISLYSLGGFCIIADVVPFHAASLSEVHAAARLATRALMRVNLMRSAYDKEVKRTNRIGVGLTGIFEFAWMHFGLTFQDLIADFDRLIAIDDLRAFVGDHELSAGLGKNAPFWRFMASLQQTVIDTATAYAGELGVPVPHTMLTVKPSGTVSKLWGLTEGAHPPAEREYLRWVQFDKAAKSDKVDEYEAQGYPVQREVLNAQGVNVYPSISLVGFPTRPLIRTLGIPEDRYTVAPEVAFDDHFKWVRLVEKFWLGAERGNQVSYTAKFDKAVTSYEEYTRTMLRWMPTVRAISVMPSSDYATTVANYGYAPEQPITTAEYETLMDRISTMAETITDDDLRCMSGACPLF